jgi:hypothetical protein
MHARRKRYLPLACSECGRVPFGCQSPATFDCNNLESTGQRVLRQVTVEIDTAAGWGTYELCNDNSTTACTYDCFVLTKEPVPGVGQQSVCAGSTC